ncbi:MAG: fibronectin type III domain-containing protein [Terriglobales bacterium]
MTTPRMIALSMIAPSMIAPRMRGRLAKARSSALLVAQVFVFAGALQIGFAAAQAPPVLEANHGVANNGVANNGMADNSMANDGKANGQKKSTKPAVSSPPQPIKCPVTGLSTPVIPPQSTGHHTVILTWKPSPDTAKTVGYCVYRRKQPSIPSKVSQCTDCQIVSEVSISGTGCIDDRVENNNTYYYVVTAANQAGVISSASNEATAEIPLKENPNPPLASSYPFCKLK